MNQIPEPSMHHTHCLLSGAWLTAALGFLATLPAFAAQPPSLADSAAEPVRYVGKEALPDTFVDGAQAVCEGSYVPDQPFQAKRIQAKCSSKYEVEYRKS